MNKNDHISQVWLAAVLLTRLPLPHLPQDAFAQGARAVWAYPLIGLLVGVAGALVGQLALGLGVPVFGAAALVLAAMAVLTGAMHEDGLADVFDGFWGGFSPERRLEIMRDSQIGTYGVLALVVAFTLRLSAVAALLEHNLSAVLAAAAVSRAMMPVLMRALPHARNDGLSRSVGKAPARQTNVACGIGALIAFLCLGWAFVVPMLLALVVCAAMGVLAKRKISGQTGDVLGATQQLSETAVLLTCASLL
ncbi:adenosylcobinamide-GDP ribazoletransferase [Sulfitobacter sp. S223]|uniref:adenosylcobinamide-GDP ribazoletransferase n=1 Tax=Sulfitobacter sp. S223 TaxID=2867023 RepID=UPI0021A87CC8|nr:adenosylcobinamide-GDP ribazoletransferase [Sulfitobacter sp. S223]UWR27501.1 adenosylcobinamide-GDP ribazoletransferase [Sulfitobacter sp. S223]